MSRYGDLSGDPEEYNPQRSEGDVSAESADVQDMLRHHTTSKPVDEMTDREVVKSWLEYNDLPGGKFELKESAGGVLIKPDGYLGGDVYGEYTGLMRDTGDISYDGTWNYAMPEFVDALRETMAVSGEDGQ